MAIKIGGTIVIDDSRGLANISNLKTVSGQSIIGSGDIQISAGGFSSINVITTDTNAISKALYVVKANLTLTLPTSPANGDFIGVSNLSGYGNTIIGRNGKDIMNIAEDMTLDVTDAGFTLYFSGDADGWIII